MQQTYDSSCKNSDCNATKKSEWNLFFNIIIIEIIIDVILNDCDFMGSKREKERKKKREEKFKIDSK